MTELVRAIWLLPRQTQRDSASTFAQGLGGVAVPMELRECSNFMGKKGHITAFVLVAERNQVLIYGCSVEQLHHL